MSDLGRFPLPPVSHKTPMVGLDGNANFQIIRTPKSQLFVMTSHIFELLDFMTKTTRNGSFRSTGKLGRKIEREDGIAEVLKIRDLETMSCDWKQDWRRSNQA
jgi:hypothetical protein